MQPIQVVWFKRDLRTRDHRPLREAVRRGPVLGLYVHEPKLWSLPDADKRQRAFIHACLVELDAELRALGGALLRVVGEVPEVLDALHRTLPFSHLHSHEETGNLESYRRDRAVKRWCREHQVTWLETPNHGVVRALKTRDGWARNWDARMRAPLIPAPERIVSPTVPSQLSGLKRVPVDDPYWCPANEGRQHGGEGAGWATLRSFLKTRGQRYATELSSPLTAADSCSRVSAHLAWGTLSMRQVHQATHRKQQDVAYARRRGHPIAPEWVASLEAFQSRLRWHCHFIQRLEDAPASEQRNLNPTFDGLREDQFDTDRFQRWAAGQTGWPLVDACMRSLTQTGWLNFRMRAMLISVSSFHLWLHWREPGLHLARLFVDYEPGIHWSQVQMQSGVTGISATRVYNPTKQAEDQDPNGDFIRKWVPELERVPTPYIHRPWTLPQGLARACGVRLGENVPTPMVDHLAAARVARERMARASAKAHKQDPTREVHRQHGSRRPAHRRGWSTTNRR